METHNENRMNTLLSQWQTCAEMANSISARRDNMNNLFVTLNLAILAMVSFLWDEKTFIFCGIGIVISVVWILFIQNYRNLNSAKFDVLLKIEQELPIQAFGDEWKVLKANGKYIEGTKLERIIPCAFVFIYMLILVVVYIAAR